MILNHQSIIFKISECKIKMNKTSFYGNDLFITYAPEYETVEDTISKLEYRNEIVNQRIIGIIFIYYS